MSLKSRDYCNAFQQIQIILRKYGSLSSVLKKRRTTITLVSAASFLLGKTIYSVRVEASLWLGFKLLFIWEVTLGMLLTKDYIIWNWRFYVLLYQGSRRYARHRGTRGWRRTRVIPSLSSRFWQFLRNGVGGGKNR